MLKFTLGCDPELWVDNLTLKTIGNLEERFGKDNCGRIAELRPQEETDPLDLIKSLRRIMQNTITTKKITKERVDSWRAGSMSHGDCLGGHIHFGGDFNPTYAGKYLDIFLAPLVIKLEDNYSARARRSKTYGRPGDVRVQKYGIEYRVPASWLTSEEITTGVLCLAGIIGQNYLDTKEVISNEVYDKVVTDLLSFSPIKLRELCRATVDRVKQMGLYPTYKDQIDIVFNYIRLNWTWFPGDGITFSDAWRLNVPACGSAA